MATELVDLGKKLIVECEGICWVSSIGQQQVSFQGNVNSISQHIGEGY